jgi:glucokinase
VDFPHVATVTGGTVFRPTRIADFGDIAFLPQVADVPEVQSAVIAVEIADTSLRGAIVVGAGPAGGASRGDGRGTGAGTQGQAGTATTPDTARTIVSRTVPTPPAGSPDAVVAAAVAMISGLVRDSEGVVVVKGIGLAVPGIVDEDSGIVVDSPTLGWTDVPFAQMVQDEFDLPVGVGKDIRVAALAEWQWGAGRDTRDMALVVAGTGVSCAVIVGGDAAYGAGYAGEIGHGGGTDGDLCACGGRGCLETYASGEAVVRRYAEATGETAGDAREVAAAAETGDAIAREVWDQAVDGLAEAISGIVRAMGTQRIVVGGGLAAAGEAFTVPLAAAIRSRLTIHRAPEVVPAVMGPRIGLYGAALMGFRAAGL